MKLDVICPHCQQQTEIWLTGGTNHTCQHCAQGFTYQPLRTGAAPPPPASAGSNRSARTLMLLFPPVRFGPVFKITSYVALSILLISAAAGLLSSLAFPLAKEKLVVPAAAREPEFPLSIRYVSRRDGGFGSELVVAASNQTAKAVLAFQGIGALQNNLGEEVYVFRVRHEKRIAPGTEVQLKIVERLTEEEEQALGAAPLEDLTFVFAPQIATTRKGYPMKFKGGMTKQTKLTP